MKGGVEPTNQCINSGVQLVQQFAIEHGVKELVVYLKEYSFKVFTW